MRYDTRRITIIVLLVMSWAGLVHAQTTYMVPMRDGVRLATDCYIPAGGGRVPTILVRTFYNKDQFVSTGQAAASYGWACVVQDNRGRYDSEGTSYAFADDGWGDRQDGIDTLAWIRAQSWSNGKIATSGGSALGIVQVLLAAAGGDVTCQSIGVAPNSFYGDAVYLGGVLMKNLFEGWTTSQGIPHVIDVFKAHPTYDSFWAQYDAGSRADHITAPGLHYGGWFDIFQQGTIDNFVTRQHNGGPGARGNQKLIVGPWPHGVMQTVGQLTFPDNYNFDLWSAEFRFFQYWLTGVDNGIMDEPAVHYYTMGACGEEGAPGNEWRTADDWPPIPTVERAYHIRSGGGLSPVSPDPDDAEATYAFDPANPCPTVGGQNLMMAAGPMDQRVVSGRPDVLKYATPPLPRPLEITGRVRVRLYVSTDAPDTDFVAKLVDIYPDGREMLMLDGVRRVKFRNGFRTPEPLPPGEIGELEIDLWSISLIFNAGHRIGLQISSSNYPRYEINPNNGDDFPGGNPMRVAQNTVHSGPLYPSALILPLRDFDGDGLPDDDEAVFHSDPNRADTDNDGLSDGFEAGYDGDAATYNPYHPVDNPAGTDLNLLSNDTDGDGLADGLEITFGSSPLDPADAASVPTGDAAALVMLALCLTAAGGAILAFEARS